MGHDGYFSWTGLTMLTLPSVATMAPAALACHGPFNNTCMAVTSASFGWLSARAMRHSPMWALGSVVGPTKSKKITRTRFDSAAPFPPCLQVLEHVGLERFFSPC